MIRSRRALLLTAAGGVLGWLSGCEQPTEAPRQRHPLAVALGRLVRGHEFTRAIGRAYLWQLKSRPNESELVARVLGSESRPATDAPSWLLRRAVREKLEADYAQGRPVVIGGWLLSDTEASLCALTIDD